MSFEVYIPTRKPKSPAKIAVQPSGMIWISTKAKKLFGDHKRVFLLYDRKRKLIGLKPTDEKKNSFCLSSTENRSDGAISGISFVEYFDIPHKESRSYVAGWNEDKSLIQIDLKKPLPRKKR